MSRHASWYGYTLLLIPKERWTDELIDFMLELPRTKKDRYRVFVALDRFSKIVHLTPRHKTDNAFLIT